MAKMDKEALMKQKFWIALGAFGLLFTLSYFTLTLTAGGPIAAKKKDYEDSKTQINSWAGKAKNRTTYLPPWEDYGKLYREHKNTIWKEAWESQKNLMKWPEGQFTVLWEKAPTFEEWKKAMEDKTDRRDTLLRTDYQQELYQKKQFPQFTEQEQQFDPRFVYHMEKAIAPVEFKNGRLGFETIMAPATGTPTGGGDGLQGRGGPGGPGGLNLGGPPGGRPGSGFPGGGEGSGGPVGGSGSSIRTIWGQLPSVEEIWLAQEDYSVKSEVLQVVRRTLDAAARLTAFTPSTPLPAGMIAQQGFKNNRWEIVLYVENDPKSKSKVISRKSTIKNLSSRVVLLNNPVTKGPLLFELRQDTAKFKLPIKGEPLNTNALQEIGDQFTVDSIDLTSPAEMVQIFDWSSSPIRRIDDIRLGYHSHRTSNLPLIASKHFEGTEPPDSTAPPGDTGATGTPPGGMPMTGGEVPGGGPGGPQGPANTTSINGLTKNRYCHVTGQARSLPIAMVLILEQNQVHEFLAELANSQLRFQITQVQMRHVRDVASQREAPPATGTPGTPSGPGTGRPGGPIVGNPGGSGTRPSLPPVGRPPVGTPGGEGSGSFGSGMGSPGVGAYDPNLVEVTIYGLSTIYEKFYLPKDENAGNPANPNGMNPAQNTKQD